MSVKRVVVSNKKNSSIKRVVESNKNSIIKRVVESDKKSEIKACYGISVRT